MLQSNPKIASASQVDNMEIDTLFKRIAERGHKIRTENKIADTENSSEETLLAGQERIISQEQTKEKRGE